jgi:hypothetical protein
VAHAATNTLRIVESFRVAAPGIACIVRRAPDRRSHYRQDQENGDRAAAKEGRDGPIN